MNYQKKLLNKKLTGENLRICIENSGFTYDDIASFLNLTTSRGIYKWVNGESMPTIENFLNLAILFNKSIEEIVVLL